MVCKLYINKKIICQKEIKSASKNYTQKGASLLSAHPSPVQNLWPKSQILGSYSENDWNPKNILTTKQKQLLILITFL